MAEKKWNDKLRQAMADYSQTPPEGLWEAVEPKMQRKAAPAAFPWWWALAGAAAAVVAVLLLWPPTMTAPAVRQDLAEAAPKTDTLDDAAPVLPGIAQDDGSMEAVEQQDAVPAGDAAKVSAPAGDSSKAGRRQVAPVVVEKAPVHQFIAEVQDDATEKAAETDNVTVADKASDTKKVSETDKFADTKKASDTDKSADTDKAPDYRELPEKLDHHSPYEQPRLAQASPTRGVSLSFVGAGIPGGPASSTITEYGMSAAARADGSRFVNPMATLLSRNKTTTTTSNHKMTFRAGLMLNVPISRHFSVETGLLYTILSSDITSVTGNIETLSQRSIYYMGVPVQAVWTPFSTRHFSCYLSAGPMVEFSFRTDWKTYGTIGGMGAGNEVGHSGRNDWLWSLGANAGVQWHPYSKGAFFLQPGVSWHIPKSGVQESFYTAQPLAFVLTAGYRIIF
ncbi:MAG: outer membrane beta-barrel protein [Bacteroidales bacterium]|nr:outer membrane beta-barrel protein [Bacteroidales bacterium]